MNEGEIGKDNRITLKTQRVTDQEFQLNCGKIEYAKIAKVLKEEKPNVMMAMTNFASMFPDEEQKILVL